VPGTPLLPGRVPPAGRAGAVGFAPGEMGGGHLPMLARPAEVVDRLEVYALGG
jgi:hypothetical protein